MKMRKPNLAAVLLVGVVLLSQDLRAEPPQATDQDKPDAEQAAADLVKAFKDSDKVFTAMIGKVQPLGQTNSVPASVFGKVTFKDLKALHGALPEGVTFSYSYREGVTPNLDLTADVPVVVAAKQKAVVAIVPATEANLAIAKKAIGGEKK